MVMEKQVGAPTVSNTSGNVVINVMVLYTNAASNFAGSAAALDLTINQAVFNTNESYQNSEIHQEIKLVPDHAIATVYQEQNDISADKRALANGDPAFANVPGLRRDNKADIVMLITKPGGATDSCGIARIMLSASQSFCSQAFAVVPVNCATAPQYSFAHELGHLMGADHDDSSGPIARFPATVTSTKLLRWVGTPSWLIPQANALRQAVDAYCSFRTRPFPTHRPSMVAPRTKRHPHPRAPRKQTMPRPSTARPLRSPLFILRHPAIE